MNTMAKATRPEVKIKNMSPIQEEQMATYIQGLLAQGFEIVARIPWTQHQGDSSIVTWIQIHAQRKV